MKSEQAKPRPKPPEIPTHQALIDDGYIYMACKRHRYSSTEIRLYTRRQENGGQCGVLRMTGVSPFQWETFETLADAAKAFDDTRVKA
jgi:hypothetical protein